VLGLVRREAQEDLGDDVIDQARLRRRHGRWWPAAAAAVLPGEEMGSGMWQWQ
jgi:hypothetical protein